MKSRSFGSVISAIVLGLSSVSTLSAMEFNEVGHKALGMGGVGVAVKNSPYGLYFNPALLGAKPGTKIGYSTGVAISHKNMFELLNYNLGAISDINGFNDLLKNNNVNAKFQAAYRIDGFLCLKFLIKTERQDATFFLDERMFSRKGDIALSLSTLCLGKSRSAILYVLRR